MKIVADDKIPFLRGVFEPYADVVYLPGKSITRKDLADADVLITRTRTKCDESLLDGTKIRMIATATIGCDHIDEVYCKKHGIRVANAPGCNAASVAQYIASVLVRDSLKNGLPLAGRTIGIIGVGNVGKKVAALAKTLGMKVLQNDPPRARREGSDGFSGLDFLCRNADYLTLHVPLTHSGPDRTFHLADEAFFAACGKHPFFINASRGETTDGMALASAIRAKQIRGATLDVWENEPDISRDLLALTDYATPHIAGYSLDGKANGTSMAVRAVAEQFGIEPLKTFFPDAVPLPECAEIFLAEDSSAVAEAVLASYDVLRDDAALRNAPADFERLRGNYPLRREFGAYRIFAANLISENTIRCLEKLGFAVRKG